MNDAPPIRLSSWIADSSSLSATDTCVVVVGVVVIFVVVVLLI